MPSRRNLLVLASTLSVPLSGCQTHFRGQQAVTLHSIGIRNDDQEYHTISVQVEENEETVFQEDYEIQPDMAKEIKDPGGEPGAYTVSASFDGGNYSRDTTATIDEGDSCVRVIWQITPDETLASEVQSYTQCSEVSE
ncbi:hypothetical protein [Salinilacihabitans rarus]|uniref:hypothetical protein n=1 Tax=Salinilacihabitans rarus TaxID=2961596 RepID=UPI0020C8C848|nr:hypothetical protein [Salinilacihabitans rarus]